MDTTWVLIPELDQKMAIRARIGPGIDHLLGTFLVQWISRVPGMLIDYPGPKTAPVSEIRVKYAQIRLRLPKGVRYGRVWL